MPHVRVKDFVVGEGQPLMVMSGPCVIESEEHCLRAAEFLSRLFRGRTSHLIFKSSYDKANRTSVTSFRGPGLQEGLRILQRVQREFGLPVVTDVHSPAEAKAAGEVCDVIQIPAFLCRQTDLVVAAAHTGKVINVKKGQFLAPWDMSQVVDKIVSTGNQNIILTDRGTSFGYNNLVADLRSVAIMKKTGFPVCFDASHSVLLPGGQGTCSGGEKEFIPLLARAAVAAGCHALFMESHPAPEQAKCDAGAQLPWKGFPELLDLLEKIYDLVRQTAVRNE